MRPCNTYFHLKRAYVGQEAQCRPLYGGYLKRIWLRKIQKRRQRGERQGESGAAAVFAPLLGARVHGVTGDYYKCSMITR